MENLGVIRHKCKIKDKFNQITIWKEVLPGVLLQSKSIDDFFLEINTLSQNPALKWSEKSFVCAKENVIHVELKLFTYLIVIPEEERMHLMNSKNLKAGLHLSEGDSFFVKGDILQHCNEVELKVCFIGEVPELCQGNVLCLTVVNSVR